MRDRFEPPRLSMDERDRRWSTHLQMRKRGIDCLVLWESV
jgi:hypothetical protein